MPPELDTLLDRFEGHAAPDSIDAQRVRLAVRARLLDESVPETRIDRYVVRQRLGMGGMGVVYAAHDGELDRVVAIKLVRGAAGADRSADQQRLLREARALAQLSHPNVVAIYDVGLHRDRVFIAMELVRGKTLRAHLVAGVTPWRAIGAAYRQAGEGLAAAHAVGLVHRDFKPDNALVGDDGRVRVLDFGLAQIDGMVVSEGATSFSTAVSPVLTATGKVVGTPAYMSPEQFAGAPADARSDQFSFCVAYWEALFGQRPFAGGTADELRMAIVLDRIAPPEHPERAPQWLRAALKRGLAHDPHSRWPSMVELLEACERPPRSRRRAKLVLGISAIAGATAFAVHAGVITQREHACAAAGTHIGELWNEETAVAVASAFEATGIPHVRTSVAMLEQRLTSWRDAWGAATERSCLAHRVDRTLELAAWERRDACLQEHRERLSTTVEVLLAPDREDVDNALRAAYDLPDNSECEDDGRLAAQAAALGPGVTIAAVAQLRRQLARAEQLALSGRATEARELATAAEQQALALGDPALQAETLLVLSIAERKLGEFRSAAALAQRAYFTATPLGADETALRAAIDLVEIHGVRLAEFDEAMTWNRHAEGQLLRVGPGHDWYAAELGEHLGSVLKQRGDSAAARAAYERAIELRIATAGPDHPAVALALVNLGGMLAERGEPEAIPYLDRAEAVLAASYGGQGTLAEIDTARCTFEMKRGNYQAAVPLCERALARREVETGHEHPHLANALNNLASARMTTGDLAGAHELMERAAGIRRARLGPLHPSLAATLNNLGLLEYHLDDYAAAEAHYSEAIEIRRVALPPGHVDIALTLCNLADVHAVQGHYARAKVLVDEAVQLTADDPTVARVHGLALVVRSKVLLMTGQRELAVSDLEAALLTSYVNEGDPVARCELRQLLADALLPDPRAHARVRELARAGLPDCVAAGERAAKETEQMRKLAGEPPA